MATILNFFRRCDIQHGKPMLALTQGRSNVAVGIASILFATWGFIYGLLDVMNSHVRGALHLTNAQGAILAAAYYAAYAWWAILVVGPLVRRFGYRISFVFGMALIGIGALVFSGAAHQRAFWMLALGQHICGLGVCTLERGANPYVTNAGPVQSRASRILFAQSIAGFGTVIAPLVAKAVLYANVGVDETSLNTVEQLYRYVSFSTFGIAGVFAAVFYRTNLVPEVVVERAPPSGCGWRIWKHPLLSMQFARLWTGAFCNFFNMACQVTIAQFFMDYMETKAGRTKAQAAIFLSVAQGLFVAGRLAPFALLFVPRVKPRHVLLGHIATVVMVSITCVFISGKAAIAFACLSMFLEAPSFPMIFEGASVGLGAWAASGETIMITSIAGGGAGPYVAGHMKDAFGIEKVWTLVAGFFSIVCLFPAFCNVIPSWRMAVDQAEDKPSEEQASEKTLAPPS